MLLYQADSGRQVQSWKEITNSRGSVEIQADDEWWQDRPQAASLEDGKTRTWSFYFVVVPAGQALDGSEVRQSTFKAVQTALPTAVAASRSLASLSSVSASLSMVSSWTASPTADPDRTLQNADSNGAKFPRWAIALIAVLGALLLIGIVAVWCLLLLFSKRRARRSSLDAQEKRDDKAETGDVSLQSAGTASSQPGKDQLIGQSQPTPTVVALSRPSIRSSESDDLSRPLSPPHQRLLDENASSIATYRPYSRQSKNSSTQPLRPGPAGHEPLARQKSTTSGLWGGSVGTAAGTNASVLAGSGREGDGVSVASSGPISPNEAEDLALAFRKAMRKAGDQ